jgi:hypothetical protein
MASRAQVILVGFMGRLAMSLRLAPTAMVCTGIALAWPTAGRAEPAVDANLVTALDGSDSIMRHEEWIELDGLLRAVASPAFLAAVRAGRHRRIGFAAFTWSSGRDLRLVVPWTVLGSAGDVDHLVSTLAKAPRRSDEVLGGSRSDRAASPDRMTDVSAALLHGLDLLESAPHPAERLILNVCGNGIDNVGEGPEEARDQALAAGVVVNGLVIGDKPGLAVYYRQRVAGGPGSFVIQARQPAAIADAMLEKLLLDLLSVDGRDRPTLARAAEGPSIVPAARQP